jgi:hypothetical protein
MAVRGVNNVMDRIWKVSVWALLDVPGPGICLEALRERGNPCPSGNCNGGLDPQSSCCVQVKVYILKAVACTEQLHVFRLPAYSH